MKGFTRPCRHLTCDADAEVNYHGFWCARHATERFVRGKVAMPEREARLGELRQSLEEVAAPAAAPEQAPIGTSLPRPSTDEGPAPTTVEDFEWILANDGWRETEWELLAGPGWLVPDTERFLKAHLNEGIEP